MVCVKRYKRYEKWLVEHGHGAAEADCLKWMLGEVKGRMSKTILSTCSSPNKIPYHSYRFYHNL